MLRGVVGAGGAGTRLAARAAFVAAMQRIDKARGMRRKYRGAKIARLFQIIDARLRQRVQQGFHSHKKKLLPCSENTHYCSIVSRYLCLPEPALPHLFRKYALLLYCIPCWRVIEKYPNVSC